MEPVCSDYGGIERKIHSLNCPRLRSRVCTLLITLKDRGFDFKAPCSRPKCWIAWHLPALNKTLFEASMHLTEHTPGAFTLSSIQGVDIDTVRSDSSLIEGAMLIHWLFKHHHCIKRLVLGTSAIPVRCFPAMLSEALVASKSLMEVQAHPVDMTESWREIRQCGVLATTLGQVSLRLECLDLTPLMIDHRSAQVIANGIRRAGSLRRLVLWSDMSHAVARKLFFAASASPSLRSLEVAGFRALSKSNALILSAALKRNNTLQKLSVRFMVEDVLSIILASLEQNGTLKELTLDYSVDLSRSALWNGLQALGANTGLSCVRLTNAGFNNSCAIVIANILRDNNSLQDLSISTNWIGNAGGRALARALNHNSCLKRFDVSANRMTSSVLQCFIDALAVNNTLEVVNLGGVDISEEWTPAWPLGGNVHARLYVMWNTRGLECCANRLEDGNSLSRLYVGWTDNTDSSSIVHWFSAAGSISASLTELIIECPLRVESASSAAVVSFLEATSFLKKLVIRRTPSSHTFITGIISALTRNKSVCEAEFHHNLRIDLDVKALQALFRANRTLHRLKFTEHGLSDKAFRLLARALEDNFVFLTFEFEHFGARGSIYPLLCILSRNRSFLNRAVECVLGSAVDSQAMEALELLYACNPLLDAVSDASGKTREESRCLVLEAVHRQKSSAISPPQRPGESMS